ncbi:hypothetical protein [Allomuricauda sp. F6463D]|uniref:hypothetical protein n=1 Tax=Allomuricauda sp. F6463D TaxID=2926409 RepID=UPI001FF3A22F|nr:hypothetical protein [Muricauda sp. F6463D]MCK0159445.1 hypothetical protein [Muricauda sp. F6463D]
MTETLISLLSIIIGITGAFTSGLIFKKYSFGIVGNTIAGVFGSILLIKLFGRLGFNPQSIIQNGTFNKLLFAINCVVSFFGGYFAVILISKLVNRMNNDNK